jgi:hypothetical protein
MPFVNVEHNDHLRGGDADNVFVEQQAMASHDMDILERTPR